METCHRQYILLRGETGAGYALFEHHGGTRVSIRASGLPQTPVRALLLAGQEGIADLGLMQQGTLDRELPGPFAGYHTLVVAADWPSAQLILHGCLRPFPGRTLCSMQESVAHYLRYPAPGSAAAPLSLPQPAPKRPVFMLRPLTTGGKRLQ